MTGDMTGAMAAPGASTEDGAFRELVGFRMTGWRDDRATMELPLEGKHMNGAGVPHGGVYALLLDSVLGVAGLPDGDPTRGLRAITLSLTTSFLAPPRGRLLIAEGWKTGGGRTTFFAEGRVRDETGVLAATASGVFRYFRS